MKTLPSFLICSSLLLLTVPLRAESLTLHLQPDEASHQIAVVEQDDERLTLGELVPGTDNWHKVFFKDTFTGYVENKEINKGLEAKPGAAVHVRPEKDSPVLTTIEEGDKTELVEAFDWAEIKFSKSLTVYFYRKPKEPEPVEEPPPPPAPVEELEVESPGATPPVPDEEIIQLPQALVDSPTEIPNPPRYFEGILKTTGTPLGLAKKAYPLQIIGEGGKRIAFIDTKNLLISSAVENYIGKGVVVYGEAVRAAKSNQVVVKARTLRLK